MCSESVLIYLRFMEEPLQKPASDRSGICEMHYILVQQGPSCCSNVQKIHGRMPIMPLDAKKKKNKIKVFPAGFEAAKAKRKRSWAGKEWTNQG